MGGAFSNGQDNDELVDNLVDSSYIRTKKIEQVFRAVDRGDYFLSYHRDEAYRDFAWKQGNIHLSAPCIYCEVMEELVLQPGLSFLNLGSGTGYLSTMAGLLLTQSGINHGIELYEDCVKYAYDRLEEFKQKSLALDEFDFCEPVFVQGNCLNVVPSRRYDRVYCGATCPESHEALIKEFVKVGGILVMPYKDHLVKAKRVEENIWEHETILPVSFANLVIPTSNDVICNLPNCDPLSLQELCRGRIRRRLRQNIWREHTDLEICKPITLERNRPSPPHRALRQFILPIFEESDDVDSSPEENLRTTLEFVRAVNESSWARMNSERDAEEERQREREERRREDRERESVVWPEEEESPSTEDTNCSSERERRDSESSSDSACDKSHSESNNAGSGSYDRNENRPTINGLSAYSNMSESESESGSGSGSEDAETAEARCVERKKASRKETADSGILEDEAACIAGNDEASFSSDSEFANGTPVKHKRSSSNRSSSSSSSNSGTRSRNSNNGHYIDSNAFSLYMKEKIHQLPLPYSLKLYINYNRNL